MARTSSQPMPTLSTALVAESAGTLRSVPVVPLVVVADFGA